MAVYIVSKINITFDISSAREYGEFKFVNERFVYGDELNGDKLPASVVINTHNVLRKFNPDIDYLMIIGDHLQLLLAAVFLTKEFGKFRVLRWDRMAKGYFPVELS